MSGKTLDQEFQAHMNWMQSMISDPKAASAVPRGAHTTRFSSQVEDLIATIEKPPQPVRPVERPSVAPSPLTPGLPAPELQYRISDPMDSDEDSECEDYYVADATEIRGQEIPEWARAGNLLPLLQKQQAVDPDQIFTNFQRTCDLNALFEKKKKTFQQRGESGTWEADGLTAAEEISYKRAVGLA
jgi:hypothetical protein